MVLPYVDADAMGLHLAEIARHVAPGAHAAAVLDGAGWHAAAADLAVPGNLAPPPLPPHSPELDPVGNVRQCLWQSRLSHRAWEDYAAIVESCCEAWNALVAEPGPVASITRREWAKTVST